MDVDDGKQFIFQMFVFKKENRRTYTQYLLVVSLDRDRSAVLKNSPASTND